MIIRAVRVELAKPLDCTWEELGSTLRTQRAVMHRLLNAAVLRCVLAHRTKEPGAIQTLAYKEVELELEKLRDWAREHKDASVRERFSELQLPGGTRAGISSIAYAQFQKWLKARGEEKLPGFRRGAPIPIRAQEWSALEDETGRPVLEVKLAAGRTGRARIAIRASRGKHWDQIRQLAAGKVERGDCKILYDERSKKWFALLAFKEDDPKPVTADPARALVVHRGVRNFLTTMSTTGHFTTVMRGNKLYAQKRALGQRMRDARMITVAERGSGSKGRGRKRRFENYDALEGKLARIIKTTCQQAAARIVTLAKQWGCGLVVIEEYGGIEPDENRSLRRFIERFPLAQLKTSIAWALKREGLQLAEVPAQYVSTTCPRCATSDERYHNRHTGVFHCSECGFERDADFVAALNMLRNSNVDASLWNSRLEQERRLAAAAR